MTTETHYLTIDGRDIEVTVSDTTSRAELDADDAP